MCCIVLYSTKDLSGIRSGFVRHSNFSSLDVNSGEGGDCYQTRTEIRTRSSREPWAELD